VAMRQLRGEASSRLQKIKEAIKEIFSQTEALLNFPEDSIAINIPGIKSRLSVIKVKLDNMLSGSKEAGIFKEGLRCVICGKTNVGKSTLFNRLLKEERVIISRFPGTTRDVIEETIFLRGVALRIYDTAGILEPKDLVEKKAIEKSSLAFQGADVMLLMLDGSRGLTKDDRFILEKVKHAYSTGAAKKAIIIINKADLKQKLNLDNIKGFCPRVVHLSALKNKGIKGLEMAILSFAYKEGLKREDIIFLNQLQQKVLETTRNSIGDALKRLEGGYTIDFVQFELQEALDAIGRLSGAIPSEEILKEIFSRFCMVNECTIDIL